VRGVVAAGQWRAADAGRRARRQRCVAIGLLPSELGCDGGVGARRHEEEEYDVWDLRIWRVRNR